MNSDPPGHRHAPRPPLRRDGTAGVVPIVLAGGASQRFGRDKLREQLPGSGWLIDRPIAALREVFGPCVVLVGASDPDLIRRGDGAILDPHPRTGPVGGILAAFEQCGVDALFVLAGDLPRIDAATIRRILDAARDAPEAWAVLARTDRTEPCIGLYRRSAVDALRASAVPTQAAPRERNRPLHAAIPEPHRRLVEVDPLRTANANTVEELRASIDPTRRDDPAL